MNDYKGPISKTFYKETYRPQFHFTPQNNWMNDPNGLIWFKGYYHLFYQYNPLGLQWGHMSWGHAISKDLLFWHHLPPAIKEENELMIFSGSVVANKGSNITLGKDADRTLVAIYTGHRIEDNRQFQCLAISNDQGRNWDKYDGNPVLDVGSGHFRDPKVFWHKASSQWIMVIVLAVERKVQFYASSDLINWNYLSDFGWQEENGGQWECPDLFKMEVENEPGRQKWLLKVDLLDEQMPGFSLGYYFVGQFDGKYFKADSVSVKGGEQQSKTKENNPFMGRIDFGRDFYAAKTFSNLPSEYEHPIWLGWLNNWQYAERIPTYPWRGMQSIPRELLLRKTGQRYVLFQKPFSGLSLLRRQEYRWDNLDITNESRWLCRGELLEIKADILVEDAKEFGFIFGKIDSDWTLIEYEKKKQLISVDRSASGIVDFHPDFAGRHSACISPDQGQLKLHIFIDRSSVEVFVNDGQMVISDLIFPQVNNYECRIYATGGKIKVSHLRIWELTSTLKQA